nr:MAG TPA: hypothetical protein [Caudoviricetes sp.]
MFRLRKRPRIPGSFSFTSQYWFNQQIMVII